LSFGSAGNEPDLASRMAETNDAYRILEGKPVCKCPIREQGKNVDKIKWILESMV
jgi:hypothetical protein